MPDTTPRYWRAEVRAITAPTPRTRRVTFGGADFAHFPDVGPDQYFKLFFPLPGQAEPDLPPPPADGDVRGWYLTYLGMPDDVRPPMRTFTVRHRHPDAIDVDFVVHASGAAQDWLRTAEVGHRVTLLGANALYRPTPAPWQLLVGDETAVPAIGVILETLAPGARATVIAHASGEAEEHSWKTDGDVDITWVRSVADLLPALRAATLAPEPPYAWLAGEASVVRDLRRHLLRDRGYPKSDITFTGYWREGKSEEQASREAIANPRRDDDD